MAEPARTGDGFGHWYVPVSLPLLVAYHLPEQISLRLQEKYAAPPLRAFVRDPPASLVSLPAEVFEMITEQLDDADKLQLMLVCFKLLEMVAEPVYRGKGQLDIDEATSYIKARVSPPPPPSAPSSPSTAKSHALVRRRADLSFKILGYSQSHTRGARIAPLLDFKVIVLVGRVGPEHAPNLAELDAIAFPHPVLPVTEIGLNNVDVDPDVIPMWTPVLRFLDPTLLSFWPEDDSAMRLPLTPHYVPYASVASLLSSWSRLDCVACVGPKSVPVVDVNAVGEPVYRFAFDQHLQRFANEQSFPVQYHLIIVVEEHAQIVWEEDLPQDLVADGALRISFHSPCGPGEQYLFRVYV